MLYFISEKRLFPGATVHRRMENSGKITIQENLFFFCYKFKEYISIPLTVTGCMPFMYFSLSVYFVIVTYYNCFAMAEKVSGMYNI